MWPCRYVIIEGTELSWSGYILIFFYFQLMAVRRMQYCLSGRHVYPNYTALQKSLFCLINTLCLAGTVCSLVVSDIKDYLVDSAFAFILCLIVLHHFQSVINLYLLCSLCLFRATWILSAYQVLTYDGKNKEDRFIIIYLFSLLLGRVWWETIPNENLTPFKLKL